MIWQDGPVTVHVGDALSVLREMPAESIHCVVTSPPYWGLRDYGIPGQLGLEATPEEYIARMVEVFGEVRRVLRKDGTLWLNLGDSYATGAGSVGQHPGGGAQGDGWTGPMTQPNRLKLPGLKPKDLVGIPWRLAFALQADGWWLRSDIVWAKPNPMPESVTDRPTKAHEYVFLLTKNARYFYDAEAVREADSGQDHRRAVLDGQPSLAPPGQQPHTGIRTVEGRNGSGRNLRSVWTIATQPYPEAHFATFPEELARRCIAAGTSEHGCCPECGAPWARMVEQGELTARSANDGQGYVLPKALSAAGTSIKGRSEGWSPNHRYEQTTTGWQPTCAHGREPVPCTVLDPFCGSGTTLAVARRMGRRAVGIELQPGYLPLIQKRVTEAALPLLEAIT